VANTPKPAANQTLLSFGVIDNFAENVTFLEEGFLGLTFENQQGAAQHVNYFVETLKSNILIPDTVVTIALKDKSPTITFGGPDENNCVKDAASIVPINAAANLWSFSVSFKILKLIRNFLEMIRNFLEFIRNFLELILNLPVLKLHKFRSKKLPWKIRQFSRRRISKTQTAPLSLA
jgi:hypothetical protein